MDELIRRFTATKDADLMLCEERGVAYQRDMDKPVEYGESYFQNYVDLEGKEIACKINQGRVALVDKYVGKSFHVVDVGIGSGEFIKNRPNTFGHDVNPKALGWLKENEKAAGAIDRYAAFTFWDVLEHVDVPNNYFKRMPEGSYLFTCLPIFKDLTKVRQSKHYKPNEHFYYWTEEGFIEWMALYRFRLLERQEFETDAGREAIVSFAFVRDLPGYHKTLEQYQQLHAAAYGTSAYLYFDQIAKEVIGLNPKSILDFGCGRSDLVAHFWKDGARQVVKYDPAIPQFKRLPEEAFNLVLCTDVMEHIPMTDVDQVFASIKAKSGCVLFTISMKPARAKLPDGRNAHVTLLNADEWTSWVKSYFGKVHRIATEWDHILMLKTF